MTLFDAGLSKAISRILMEVRCPACGTERAYVGFSSVECPNPLCQHYPTVVLFNPADVRITKFDYDPGDERTYGSLNIYANTAHGQFTYKCKISSDSEAENVIMTLGGKPLHTNGPDFDPVHDNAGKTAQEIFKTSDHATILKKWLRDIKKIL